MSETRPLLPQTLPSKAAAASTLIEFADRTHTITPLHAPAQIDHKLANPLSPDGPQWLIITGDLDPAVVPLLSTRLSIDRTILQPPQPQTQFGGGALVVSKSSAVGLPEQACVSFAVPIDHCDALRSLQTGSGELENGLVGARVLRLGCHLVLSGRTVVCFLSCGAKAEEDSTDTLAAAIRRQVLDAMSEQSVAEEDGEAPKLLSDTLLSDTLLSDIEQVDRQGAWQLLCHIIHAVQQQHLGQPVTDAADEMRNIWARIELLQANDQRVRMDAGKMRKMLHIMHERCRTVQALTAACGQSVACLIGELDAAADHTPAVDNRGFCVKSKLRARLKQSQHAIDNCEKEFASHVGTVKCMIKMTKEELELQHIKANTLLSMVAAIFLPLTFLCGVYGMNFNTEDSKVAIPLLSLGNGFGGYMVYWGLCVTFILILLLKFNHNGWLEMAGVDGVSRAALLVGAVFAVAVIMSLECGLWFGARDELGLGTTEPLNQEE